MKNIFIGGVAKSGKSRLAEYFCKNGKYNHIPVDYFTSSFKHNFKDIGITSDVIINEKSSELLSLFLSRFIEIVESKNDEYFILDSAHILPSDIIKYLDPSKWDIYYIGYGNTTPEEKLNDIKRYNCGGWIKKHSDDELLNIFSKLIELSKEIESECKKYNIKYLDTSNSDVLKIIK